MMIRTQSGTILNTDHVVRIRRGRVDENRSVIADLSRGDSFCTIATDLTDEQADNLLANIFDALAAGADTIEVVV